MDDIRIVCMGIPGTPIFEVGERISEFHELSFITIERYPEEIDSYFQDKIPAQYIDTGDFTSGSSSEKMERDPLALLKEKDLDNLEVPKIDMKLYPEEIEMIYEEEEGFVSSEIPDKALVTWATHVCILNADTDKAIEWFSKRLKCPACGSVFHLEDKPPLYAGICDRCGTDLKRKPEDNPENVKELYAQWRKDFNRVREACKSKANYLQVRVDQCADFEDICTKVDRWLRKTTDLYSHPWQYKQDRKNFKK